MNEFYKVLFKISQRRGAPFFCSARWHAAKPKTSASTTIRLIALFGNVSTVSFTRARIGLADGGSQEQDFSFLRTQISDSLSRQTCPELHRRDAKQPLIKISFGQ
jgi:hypothetical protein